MSCGPIDTPLQMQFERVAAAAGIPEELHLSPEAEFRTLLAGHLGGVADEVVVRTKQILDGREDHAPMGTEEVQAHAAARAREAATRTLDELMAATRGRRELEREVASVHDGDAGSRTPPASAGQGRDRVAGTGGPDAAGLGGER